MGRFDCIYDFFQNYCYEGRFSVFNIVHCIITVFSLKGKETQYQMCLFQTTDLAK